MVSNHIDCRLTVPFPQINTIVGASALSAVGPKAHQLPSAVGVIIIAVLTTAVALFGYRYVHAFERWASLPIAVSGVIFSEEELLRY